MPGAAEGGVRRHHDDAVDAEVERRLDRRIEPRAAVEEPVRVRPRPTRTELKKTGIAADARTWWSSSGSRT
jgi:hypothetical protein